MHWVDIKQKFPRFEFCISNIPSKTIITCMCGTQRHFLNQLADSGGRIQERCGRRRQIYNFIDIIFWFTLDEKLAIFVGKSKKNEN